MDVELRKLAPRGRDFAPRALLDREIAALPLPGQRGLRALEQLGQERQSPRRGGRRRRGKRQQRPRRQQWRRRWRRQRRRRGEEEEAAVESRWLVAQGDQLAAQGARASLTRGSHPSRVGWGTRAPRAPAGARDEWRGAAPRVGQHDGRRAAALRGQLAGRRRRRQRRRRRLGCGRRWWWAQKVGGLVGGGATGGSASFSKKLGGLRRSSATMVGGGKEIKAQTHMEMEVSATMPKACHSITELEPSLRPRLGSGGRAQRRDGRGDGDRPLPRARAHP